MVSANDYAKPYLYAYMKKGGQVQDPNGDRESGFNDTICLPYTGFSSHLSRLVSSSSSFSIAVIVVSITTSLHHTRWTAGIAIELPFIYQSNVDGHGLSQDLVTLLFLSIIASLYSWTHRQRRALPSPHSSSHPRRILHDKGWRCKAIACRRTFFLSWVGALQSADMGRPWWGEIRGRTGTQKGEMFGCFQARSNGFPFTLHIANSTPPM